MIQDMVVMDGGGNNSGGACQTGRTTGGTLEIGGVGNGLAYGTFGKGAIHQNGGTQMGYGGGGLYGGGTGDGGGGGGSGYVNMSILNNASGTNGTQSGNGQAKITLVN